MSKQPGQLEIHSPGLAPSGWHDHQVSLAGALDAQVAVEVAELEKLLVAHVDHRREAEDQGWDLDESQRFAHGFSPSSYGFMPSCRTDQC